MKLKRLLSVIASAVMAITSVALTAFFTSADDSLDYTSTVSTKISFDFLKNNEYGKNYYFVIDNYKDYIACGLKEKSKDFFNDNILLVNYIYNPVCACDVYTNNGVVKNADNTLSVSYKAVWEYSRSDTVEYATDIIELKKNDVKNVDFSKLTVGVYNEYIDDGGTSDGLPSSSYEELEMNYIDIPTYNHSYNAFLMYADKNWL